MAYEAQLQLPALGGAVAKGCQEFRSPDFLNFGISLYAFGAYNDRHASLIFSLRFILVGILVSYLPQHWRIVARHSSEGLSPYYVLLGTTSGTCAFANVLTQAASQRAMGCCKEVKGIECTASLLGIAQIGVQWACFTIMYGQAAGITISS